MARTYTEHMGRRYRPARPEPQTVDPACLINPTGTGAPILESRPKNPTEALGMLPEPSHSFVPPESPYQASGSPSTWTGSLGYHPEYVRRALRYRPEGVNLKPISRYEPEPLEPLFGLDYHLRPLRPASQTLPWQRGPKVSRKEELIRRVSASKSE